MLTNIIILQTMHYLFIFTSIHHLTIFNSIFYYFLLYDLSRYGDVIIKLIGSLVKVGIRVTIANFSTFTKKNYNYSYIIAE